MATTNLDALTLSGALSVTGATAITGALTPGTSDGSALGSTALQWSDLFLASGGVINFNNGAITITHSTTGKLAVAATWTTAAATGRPFAVNFTTNVSLGSYANAFKANVDLSAKGGATGLLSAGNFEVTNATTGIAGNIACVEMEMTYGATCGALAKPCFMYVNSNGTAKTDFDDYGDFIKIGTGMTAATGHIIGAGTSTLRIGTGALSATKRYIPLSTAEASYTSAYPVVLTYAGTALGITSTITSADNVAEVIGTTTATSGTNSALKTTLQSTGAAVGYAIGHWIELDLDNTATYAYGQYIYNHTVADKAVTQMCGIYMYLEDMGNAVQHKAGISINRNIAHVGTASDCFLQMRNHGAVAATAFIKATGGATHLFDFQDGDLGAPLSEASDSANVSHKVSVKMPDGSTRYFHLFTD